MLINRYQREYYVSFDGTVRVTLDYSERSYDQRAAPVPNLTRATPPSYDMVVELKANAEHREGLAEVVSRLPLRVGRNSKYVRGVQHLLGSR